MSDAAAARVHDARARLVRELSALAEAAAASALERCPYRDRDDGCTFARGCRNQRRTANVGVRCSGGPLDPRPA